MNPEKSLEFFVDFYAKDDNEDEYNEGELSDVHCGRIKVIFNIKTVCSDWSTITSVIPKEKFIGWGHKGITKNCYHYCLEQLRVVGHWVKTERWNKKWDGTKELNDDIYQIYLESDVAGMQKGAQKNQFLKGIEYLKKALKNNKPVMVGVDDDITIINDDMTTEHFVVIVGMGKDSNGKFFTFYDNAINNPKIGASSKNKLYCDCKNFKLEGIGDLSNSYIRGTLNKKYRVSQIRETK